MVLNRIIDSMRDDLIRSTQELIAIPSVKADPLPGKPFGEGVDQALAYVLNLGRRLGFRVRNVDGYAGYAEFGQGDQILGILVHLDVVPEGSGWTYPPYGGEIHDGKIFGRGAVDDKGPAVAALYAMKAVMESGLPVNKKVRIIFGTNEESGTEDLEYFFQREPKPDFAIVPDAEYPVIHAEKGILTVVLDKTFQDLDCLSTSLIRLFGGLRPNMVPDECTAIFQCCDENEKVLTHLTSFVGFTGYRMKADFSPTGDAIVRSFGTSAHGSTPEKGKNAIGQMLAFLATLGLGNSDLERFILLLNDRLDMDTTGERMNMAFEDAVSGRLTVNLGIINLDRKRGEAVLDIRYPVETSKEEVLSRIKAAFEGSGVRVREESSLPPLYVPEDHPLVQTLLKVYAGQTGKPAKAKAIGGGTYARSIPNAVAFGPHFPGKPEMEHQRDEYIEIDDLILNARIYATAISELAK